MDTMVIEWKPDQEYEMRSMNAPSVDSLFCGSGAAPITKNIQDESRHNDRYTSGIAQASVAVSPTLYLARALKNHNIKERIESFSLEQAMYFEPYKESEIPLPLLQALRSNDLKQLQLVISSRNYDLEDARNQFGENFLHLACRMGLSTKIVEYLVLDTKSHLTSGTSLGVLPSTMPACRRFPTLIPLRLYWKKLPNSSCLKTIRGKRPWTGFFLEILIGGLVSWRSLAC
ncbi:hypothetical protein IV203_017445 [Nitzschia inconspicua]|uniref:Ankyrin repeat protein n=1 Tax=Nitzschia inconspicua TaxID=303405 RepID=A0A9K3PBH1_9STRA|nr:hypothetical protein IV203_017445 [Nitzschia inconspicua]